METATRSTLLRPELVDPLTTHGPSAASLRTLTVVASFILSEEGRKASLLAGGDGRALQHIEIQVPSNRLHLVAVNGKGVARLKLRPRFQMNAEQRLVCVDALPVYDAPPTIDELLREAARNHQLERAFRAERTAESAKRSETDRTRRSEIAAAFLADQSQRALVYPAPSARRCYLATAFGRMRFDAETDDGPARDVPREALRRFRADVAANKHRREREHAENSRLHDERWQAITAWVAENGTADQRARHAAGLLPASEVLDAMADEAFRPLRNFARYVHDGAIVMAAHVQQWTGRSVEPVLPHDFVVFGHPARSATSAQWARLQEIQRAVPDADVSLHHREFVWRRESGVPRYSRLTVVLTKRTGPIVLRREYVLPGDGSEAQ